MKNAIGKVHNILKPLKEVKFDKIVSCQVIQHIPTRELKIKALKNIKEMLKEGGTFICELYDWTSIKRRLQRLKQRIGGAKVLKEETEGFYIYRFNPKEFKELLLKAGFKDIKIKRRGGYFLTIAK